MSIVVAGELDARFPRSRRLVRSIDYRQATSIGSRSRDNLFRVFARENGERFGRVGLTVSRHTAPRAVDRNRIKRVIRESFRHHQNKLMGLDVVAVARKASRDEGINALFISLERHWQNVSQERECAD